MMISAIRDHLSPLWRFRISNLRQTEVENVECNSFYTDDWIDYVNIHLIIESNQHIGNKVPVPNVISLTLGLSQS